jgi:hypothetical protein
MRYKTKVFGVLIAISGAVYGQKLDLSSLDGITARAQESVNVMLDAEKLKLASQFLSKSDADTKQILERLTGVFVRSFEFEKPIEGGFPELKAIRSQLSGPGWSKIVEVKEKGASEATEIYLFTKDGDMGGLAVIAAEKNELTVVNIAGAIRLEDLGKLKGSLGIPGLGGPAAPSTPAPPAPPHPPKKQD